MKTIKEVEQILSKCKHVDSHVHTHLCDGGKDMTVENIAKSAKQKGVDGVILTPHYHKQVSDGETTLYEDSNESIFLRLREEIDAYEKRDGSVKILLSTEADIINTHGELSLSPSLETEKALDFITPTLNYHPALPLVFVGLTMGKFIDELHESGTYEKAAAELGGIPGVLSGAYEIQSEAIRRCPYPAMLGHIFMVHSFHPFRNNCFGAKREHLDLMKQGMTQMISACQSVGAMVDLTGVHIREPLTVEDKIKNNDFLVDLQKFAIRECKRMGVTAYYGSDGHSLGSIGGVSDYYEKLNELDYKHLYS